MTRKSQVLQLLGRGELQEIADEYELDVADRRVKDDLIEVIVHSKISETPRGPGDLFPRHAEGHLRGPFQCS